jgi:endonuclease/exonuclease/phosphatase family metal-dependent hydrolase
MSSATFASYNTLDLFKHDNADERVRHGRVIQVIRDLDVDILAVQEVAAPDADRAGQRLRDLASAVGMRCHHAPGRVAVGVGPVGLHVGLLWRDGLDVVAGSFRAYPDGRFRHNLATLTVDIDGRQVRHASYHAPPFGRTTRADEAEWVASVLTRPPGRPPGLVAAGWNTPGDDRNADGSHYDPDPYTDQPWHPDLIHQTRGLTDARGRDCTNNGGSADQGRDAR